MILLLLMPLTFLGILEKIQAKTADRPAALAGALLCYEAFILLLANVLSFGHFLNAMSASAAWLIAVLLLFTFPRDKDQEGILLPVLKKRAAQIKTFVSAIPKRAKEGLSHMTPMELTLLILSTLLCLILLFLALFNVPYNYDSMTYHLARIAHWIDNGSVNYYLTNIDRQLYSPVLSEYNLLFMLLLGGSDLLLNLHQYAAMLLSAYFIFVILKKLHTKTVFCLFAVFAYLSMPLTMSQAITTQNDLCAALWYLVFLYYVISFIEKCINGGLIPSSPVLYICIGASVGFAYLMKPSVCASMVMFLPWVLVVCLKKKDNILPLIKAGVTVLLTLLVTISETLMRTYMACGSFVSSATGSDIMVATKNVKYIIVNILKNYSLLITQHFVTDLNGFIYRIAISVGRILQVEVNNEAIAFHGFDFITYLNTGLDMYSHDRTSSAFAAYLALVGGVLLVISLIATLLRRLRKKEVGSTAPISYGFVISSWLGFGFIMALLRWQPWGSRLMYPALVVAMIASVHIAGQMLSGSKNASGFRKVSTPVLALMTILTILLAIKPLSDNSTVALSYLTSGLDQTKKEALMFESHKHSYDSYIQLMDQLQKTDPTDIALVISGDGYDYPFWKMVRMRFPQARIRHIIVDDTIMETLDADSLDLPDCIVWIERGYKEAGTHLDFFGQTYTCGFVTDAPETCDAIFYFDAIVNGKSKASLTATE